MDVIPPPGIPTQNPRRELKDECKSKLACAESREMAKTLQIPMRKATPTGKHRKKTMRNGQPSRFLDSAARRLWHFFAKKHRKYRRKQKSQNKFRERKVPKFESQHMPARKSTHPARRQTHVLPTTTTTTTTTTRKREGDFFGIFSVFVTSGAECIGAVGVPGVGKCAHTDRAPTCILRDLRGTKRSFA